jgi:hypothetical protein
LVGLAVTEAISLNPALIENPTIYLSMIFHERSPLFVIAPQHLLSHFFSKFVEAAESFEQFIQTAISGSFSIPNLIRATSWYFEGLKAQSDGDERRLESLCAKLILGVRRLYELDGSVDAAIAFSRCLTEAADRYDCVHLLLGQLAFSETSFRNFIVIARNFYVGVAPVHRSHFMAFLGTVVTQLPYDSRGRALSLMPTRVQEGLDAAFMLAMSDSSDQTLMDSIFDEYTKQGSS